MPVYKRKYDSGTVLWYYKFQAPGAKRGTLPIREFGFATKREAEDAEAKRRTEEQQKFELAKAGSGVAAAPPKTLSMLLDEFFRQHAEKKLAPKTIERYQEQLACLDPALLAMPLADITPLHLSREWNRLLESGGHTRRDKTPRPLSAKTVRNIAGVVSSAFARARAVGDCGRQPGEAQRAASSEEANEEAAHASRAGHGVRSGHRPLVPTDVSADGGRHRRSPRGGPGASLVGHQGRPDHHRTVAHADQACARFQIHQNRQSARGGDAAVDPWRLSTSTASSRMVSASSSVPTTGPTSI